MGKNNGPDKSHLPLKSISAKNEKQKDVLRSDKNLLLHGWPGTGKTFLALYKALDLLGKREDIKRVIIIRSAVATRDIGFMPGTLEEKTKIYEDPYIDICHELYGRGDSYDILKKKGLVEFFTTSNIRGRNIKNSVVIVDECANLTYHELRSVITRIDDNSIIYLCGDKGQTDIKNDGVERLERVLSRMPEDFDMFYFGKDDIVRSGVVRRFIIAENTNE